jgi:hypothetical protein
MPSNKLMLSGIFLFVLMYYVQNNMHIRLHLFEVIIPLIGVVLFIFGLITRDNK